MQIYPDDRTGVFVTFNSGGRGEADTLTLRQSLLSGFADRYFPPAPTGPRPASTTATEVAASTATDTAASHAAMAEGTYESARAPFNTFLAAIGIIGQTRVTARADGTVLIEPGPMSPYPAVYREIEPWVWQEVGGQRIVAMRAVGDKVEALGFESAFTLLRAEPARDAGIALPVLLTSAAVLLISLLAWPIGAIIRRRYAAGAPVSLGRVGGAARVLTRIAAACAVVALAGWTTAVLMIIGLQDVPEPVLRAMQGAQWAALIGVIPAAVGLVVTVQRRAGRARILGSVLPLLALVGTAWFALFFGLVSPSVSY
jgi:hypothetical protein